MSAQWLPANDAVRTDWEQLDPLRVMDETEATIPCGLRWYRGVSGLRECPERFFSEEGRDMHHHEPKALGGHGLPSDFPLVDKRKALAEKPGAKPRPRAARDTWWDR
jgi:hypothetical protein